MVNEKETTELVEKLAGGSSNVARMYEACLQQDTISRNDEREKVIIAASNWYCEEACTMRDTDKCNQCNCSTLCRIRDYIDSELQGITKIEDCKWYKYSDVSHLIKNYVGRYFVVREEYEDGNYDIHSAWVNRNEYSRAVFVSPVKFEKKCHVSHIMLVPYLDNDED